MPNPAVVRLTAMLADATVLSRQTVRFVKAPDHNADDLSLIIGLAAAAESLQTTNAALTDRLARAEADGMLKAAKLECGRCGSDDPILLNPTPNLFGRYHPLPDREGKPEYLYCRASAIHAALAEGGPKEGE